MSTSPLTTLYIVRHGQSHGNVNPTEPHPDPELTDEGRKQVEEVAQKLADLAFDLIVHSDYIRAVQTAEILNAQRKLATEMYPNLKERNYGSFHKNKSKEELQKFLDEFHQKLDELTDEDFWDYKHVDDMESEREALNRFTSALKEVITKHSGKKMLVVGHGNLMRTFLSHIGYAHFKELPPNSFANAGYIVVKTDGDNFFLEEVVGAKKRVLEK